MAKTKTTALVPTTSKAQSVELRRLEIAALALKVESDRNNIDAQLIALGIERNDIQKSFATQLQEAEITFKEGLETKESEYQAKIEVLESSYQAKESEINDKIANLTNLLNQKQEEYKRNLEALTYQNSIEIRNANLAMAKTIVEANKSQVISNEDLADLNKQIEEAEKNLTIAVNSAVKNAKESLTNEYTSQIQELKVAAQLSAVSLTSLEKENASLIKQVEELKAAAKLKDEQVIKMLEAAKSNVNVSSGK